MKKTILIISLVGFLTACNNGGGIYDNRGNRMDTTSRNSDYSDSNITGRVSNALMSDSSLSASGRNVGVDTNNGIVTLTGSVPTRDEVRYIERKVKSIDGVRKVDNRLTIYP